MKGIQSVVALLLITALITGCGTRRRLERAMLTNPSEAVEVVVKNPQMFKELFESEMASLQSQERARVEKALQNPKNPEVANRAMRGNPSAPVQIVEYSDFESEFSKKSFFVIEELRKKYGNKIAFVYKHFLSKSHAWSKPAAERFEAIALQSPDKAYRYHDYIFNHHEKLVTGGEKFLDEAAKASGANLAQMQKDMKGDKVKAKLENDQKEARAMGFKGIPSFVVAGVAVPGFQTLERFEPIIQYRLEKPSIN